MTSESVKDPQLILYRVHYDCPKRRTGMQLRASETMRQLNAQDLTKNNLTIKSATTGCQARDTKLIALLKIASIFKNIINSILNKK
mgnify:CR=1 FL=1